MKILATVPEIEAMKELISRTESQYEEINEPRAILVLGKLLELLRVMLDNVEEIK